jgi:uncharacterized protein
VALVWDSHVHHAAAVRWFEDAERWATCSVTELGFVRVSSNPKVLPHAVTVAEALAVLERLRGAGRHVFLADDLSPASADAVRALGPRGVTDAHLVGLARRHGTRLTTFDRAAAKLGQDVELLRDL